MIQQDTITYSALVESVQTFLSVFVHNILYYFNVYPSDAFTQVRQYNTAVWLCRAPVVKEYIDEVSQECIGLMKEGKSVAMAIALYNTANKPVARIPVQFTLPFVAESDQTVPITDAPNAINDLQLEFNAFFTRLANYGPNFNPTNLEHTFKIQMELEGEHALEGWITSDGEKGKKVPGLEDVVVRKIEAGPVEVVSWVEYV